MSSGNDNLHDALRALAEETSSASAPDQVRANLRAELRARARRKRISTWWPAAAAAALILGIWLGMPSQQSPSGASNQVAEVQPTPPPIALPEPKPVTEEATPRDTTPLVFRESAAAPSPATRARLVTASSAADRKPVTPWFFYAGLPATERGQVVGIQVNRETAAQFGVYTASATVPAQVFIGDDGLTRAIRFVR